MSKPTYKELYDCVKEMSGSYNNLKELLENYDKEVEEFKLSRLEYLFDCLERSLGRATEFFEEGND